MSLFETFKSKKVIVTGHTGFKGSWLVAWLNLLGSEVLGVSNGVPSNPCHYKVASLGSLSADVRRDIRDTDALKDIFLKFKPDFVFHLAAQALVRPSYKNPLETISVNSLGTASVLECLKQINNEVIAIMITSDKVYQNNEWEWGYRETDQIGGSDPYSASKGMAELLIHSYFESFFCEAKNNVKIGIARAGNVIGGGDWAIDRVVPDCVKAWAVGETVEVRNPHSTRPWQHVLEPLSGYLSLAADLYASSRNNGEAFNFGPISKQNYSVSKLIAEMSKYWRQVKWNSAASIGRDVHEAGLLKLNCDKALAHLGWMPTLTFDETVRFTVDWYKNYYENNYTNMFEFTALQIEEYTKLATDRALRWTKNKE